MDTPSIRFSVGGLIGQQSMQLPGFILSVPTTAAVKNSDFSSASPGPFVIGFPDDMV